MNINTRTIIEVELTYRFRYDPEDWDSLRDASNDQLQEHFLRDARASVENGGESPSRWTTRVINESTTS
jgi:hypothetical protein